MKKLHFICLLSTVVATFTTSGVNAQNKSNWYDKFYVRGDIGAFIPVNKFKDAGDNDPYSTKKPKQTAIYNIGIGYKITDYIRSDLNFSSRNFGYKALDTETNIAASQKIKSHSVSANGYFDFINISKLFKPYLTAGIGYGFNKSKDLITQDINDPNVRLDYPGTKQNNFIWNVGLGTKFIINDALNLDISYKYVDLGKIKTKMNPDDDGIPTSQKIKSHEIMGGVIIHL